MADAVHSMTGAGTATASNDAGTVSVELRAVNHRFLKTSVRAPVAHPAVESALDERLRRRLHRGHVTGIVRFTPAPGRLAAQIDDAAFREVSARLRELARGNSLPEPGVGDVLGIRGVSAESSTGELAPVLELALEAFDRALEELEAARRREGDLLVVEMGELLGRIAASADAVEQRAKDLPNAAQARLTASLEALLEGSGVAADPALVAREIALLADRMDVREEVTRLRAHIAHAHSILGAGGAVGRRLDFLVQEMHREASTMANKAPDAAMSRVVVDLKSDVERLREQVQNLE